MSAVIKTTTPFVIESVLVTALQNIGAEPQLVTQSTLSSFRQRNRVVLGDILTNRQDFNGRQFFRHSGDRWSLLHDSDEHAGRIVSRLIDKRYQPVTRFLDELSHAYNEAHQNHLLQLEEQERQRIESERKARVEATRQKAIANAKASGYSVKESRKGNQIQLVLTRRV